MDNLVLFEQKQVRRAWNEVDQKWYFGIVDVVGLLTDNVDAGSYWRKLKERLKKEGNETATDCHAFKMTAADGRQLSGHSGGFDWKATMNQAETRAEHIDPAP